MENIYLYYNNIQSYLDNISSNLNLIQILILFIVILATLLFNSFIANFIVNKLKILVKKTDNTIDDKLFDALIPPCRFLPIVIIFFFSIYKF